MDNDFVFSIVETGSVKDAIELINNKALDFVLLDN